MEKKLLAQFLDRFADEMRVRNWSGGTIVQYLKSLGDFERFVIERYPSAAAIAGITAPLHAPASSATVTEAIAGV